MSNITPQTNPGSLQQRAPQMFIQDLKTLETLTAQFNPANLAETVSPVWNDLVVPGLSHAVKQYSHTKNHAITFELIWDSLAAGNVIDLDDARKFLLSLCYSKKGAQNVIDGEASRVLFVWPQLFSLTCVIVGLDIKHTAFNIQARPTYMTATIKIEEIRDARLFSEDVRNEGTQRVSSADQQTAFINSVTSSAAPGTVK